KNARIAVRIAMVGLTVLFLSSGALRDEHQRQLLLQSAEAQELSKPPLGGGASEGRVGGGTHAPQPDAGASMPTYKPPLRGAPEGRVGGGTRGGGTLSLGDQLPTLSVLAPNHTGLTIHEQPSLYWYLSGTTSYPVEVTLTLPRSPKPLFETRLS